MSERTVIAYFEVDEDRAFDGFGDGPVPYLEHEAVCLEKRGIFLTGAAIADEDADDLSHHLSRNSKPKSKHSSNYSFQKDADRKSVV